MRSLLSRSFFLILLVLFGLVVSSCASAFALPDPPTPVTPDVTGPSTLHATLNITDDQNSSDAKVQITLQFSTNEIKEQNYAIFTHGESVNCNGNSITLGNSATYALRVPRVAPGDIYECKYSSPYGDGLIYQVTARTVLSPQFTPGSSDSRFMISYTADSSGQACPIKIDAADSFPSTVSGTSNSGIGGYRTAGLSALKGLGMVVLTRTCQISQNNNVGNNDNIGSFDSVTGTYTSIARVPVLWCPPGSQSC